MSIPFNLSPLGMVGTGILPVGYLQAEFLDNKGANYFLLDMPVNNEMGLSYEMINLAATNGFPISWQKESPFKCFRIVNSWSGANGSVIWWGTTLSSILNPSGKKVLYECNFKNNRKLIVSSAVAETKEITINEFSCNYNKVSFGKILEYRDSTVVTHDWAKIKIYSIKLSSGVNLVYDLLPVIDTSGKACLYDKVSKQAYYGKTSSAFIVGMTIEQARKLGKLPKTGGTLTVSLPWEAGVDAEVQEALAKAAERGWTVVVQYREPEAATENIAADFLESTGTQYMKMPLNLSAEDSVRIVQEHFCVTRGNFFEGQNTFNVDKCVLRVGQYDAAYYLNRGDGASLGKITLNSWVLFDCYFYGTMARLTQRDGTIIERDMGTSAPCKEYWLWRWNNSTSQKRDGKKKYFKVEVNEAPYCDMVPTLDTNGVPCMYDKVTSTNIYNAGTGAFIAGFESTEKAALGLAKLPVVEAGELTVSLPAAAQEEATRVPAAIEVARQRGWTILTQYREN